MTLADVAEYVGYLLGAYGLGFAAFSLPNAVRRAMERAG